MAGKSFISNILLLILLNVLVKPVWILLIDRNVQLLTGHETYGLYNALMNLSLIFSILLDMGITNYNNKRIAYKNSIATILGHPVKEIKQDHLADGTVDTK